MPICQICGHESPWLGDHLSEAHKLNVEQYLGKYPAAEVVAPEIVAELQKTANGKRAHPPAPTHLTADFAGVVHKVNHDVPPEVCLPLPDHYRIPSYGALAEDVSAASIALKNARSLYIHGASGCGKDGFVSAWSALHRVPGEEFQVIPNTDLQPWLWSKSINRGGTYWEEGRLLRLARDGYKTTTGRQIPALILITDLDRATKSQIEIVRLLLDTIQGRVPRPDGGSWPVLPGTHFVATANTAGQGDETGRYTSSTIIDFSILSRFQRKLRFHMMDWRDEEPILRAKFPLFAEKMGDELTGHREAHPGRMTTGLGMATHTLREHIESGDLFAEFSHRELCNWVQAAEDILSLHPRRKPPEDLMRQASRCVFDGYPDEETRLRAKRLIHGHITGGLLDSGDVQGVSDESLSI